MLNISHSSTIDINENSMSINNKQQTQFHRKPIWEKHRFQNRFYSHSLKKSHLQKTDRK